MPSPIEDYALIGNQETVALVARDGSIDWMGMPRFDSPACFAALLGAPEHGRWLVAPAADKVDVKRHYRDGSTVLETRFTTADGEVAVIDFMARREGASDLMRIVRGVRGCVAMRTELVVRFDSGAIVPWVSRQDDGRWHFTAGPDRLTLATPLALRGEDMRTVGEFEVGAGDEVTFSLTWQRSWREDKPAPDVAQALAQVEAQWETWSARLPEGDHVSEAVRRSLVTLKALAHWETGGIVAAATTSLPEKIGGTRNWDYRFCWLRDATFTLYALLELGFVDEAEAWRAWLVRAVAGSPDDLQIMYGVAGERRLDEYEVPWLPGYENSAPVRVGNAAAGQVQLDVYGEVLECLHQARRHGLRPPPHGWGLQRAIVEHLEAIWDQPDEGIWEVRGGARDFTFSKIMAWVALDRMVRDATKYHLSGDIAGWRNVRDKIHAEVLARGFDEKRNTFTQSFGSTGLDASLLLIPMVGFLPANDPRVRGTVAAVERELMIGGFVQRYSTETQVDGLPPGEGAFLACSFWLADAYALQGRTQDAEALFERLLDLRNDVGLLSEEYDPRFKRLVGNFPQAFSHVALVGTAMTLIGRGARNGG